MSKPLSPSAVEILREASVEGNAVRLNCGQLEDRGLYKEVDQCLVHLGGKWVGRKKQHEFPYEPAAAIEAVVGSGLMPEKNPNDYFPTPDPILDEIFRCQKVLDGIDRCIRNGLRVLEPSAGQGAIAKRLVAAGVPKEMIDCVEYNFVNAASLREQGFNVIEGDFLQHQTEERYGLIVMNPPFSLKGNTRFYADHIAHAHTMLDKGGTLAAITPPSLLDSSDKKNDALCDLVGMNCGEVWRNGAGAFKDAGTSIDTVTLVFTDEGPDWMDTPIEGYPSNGVMQVSMAVETDGALYSARAAIVEEMAEATTTEELDELRTSVRSLYQGLLSNMRAEGHIVHLREKDFEYLVNDAVVEACPQESPSQAEEKAVSFETKPLPPTPTLLPAAPLGFAPATAHVAPGQTEFSF